MIRTPMFWRVTAAVYTIINVGGLVYAAAMGEGAHAAGHVGLLVLGLGAYLIWRPALSTRREDEPQALGQERLDYLQQSVDAIALEVERIGEAQRFSDKLRAGRAEIAPGTKPPQQEIRRNDET
jgi:hypothetical protein